MVGAVPWVGGWWVDEIFTMSSFSFLWWRRCHVGVRFFSSVRTSAAKHYRFTFLFHSTFLLRVWNKLPHVRFGPKPEQRQKNEKMQSRQAMPGNEIPTDGYGHEPRSSPEMCVEGLATAFHARNH
jgi:hypothetical protein